MLEKRIARTVQGKEAVLGTQVISVGRSRGGPKTSSIVLQTPPKMLFVCEGGEKKKPKMPKVQKERKWDRRIGNICFAPRI